MHDPFQSPSKSIFILDAKTSILEHFVVGSGLIAGNRNRFNALNVLTLIGNVNFCVLCPK